MSFGPSNIGGTVGCVGTVGCGCGLADGDGTTGVGLGELVVVSEGLGLGAAGLDGGGAEKQTNT